MRVLGVDPGLTRCGLGVVEGVASRPLRAIAVDVVRTPTDADLVTIRDLSDGDRFPLWYYLVHIVTHSEQQRRDAQLILRHLGHEPPDLEFLYYADALAPSADGSGG